MKQYVTQKTGVSVMIGNWSLVSQHGETCRHPASVGCYFIWCTNHDLINQVNQRFQRRKWTKEYNKVALQIYFKSLR